MTASPAPLLHPNLSSNQEQVISHRPDFPEGNSLEPTTSNSSSKSKFINSSSTNTNTTTNTTTKLPKSRCDFDYQFLETSSGSSGGTHTTTNPTLIPSNNETNTNSYIQKVTSDESTSPKQFPVDDLRHTLLYKVGGGVYPKKSSVSSSRKNSNTSLKDTNSSGITSQNQNQNPICTTTIPEMNVSPPSIHKESDTNTPRNRLLKFSTTSTVSSPATPLTRSASNNGSNFFPYKSYHSSPVKETKHVFLEYDPITRRKVLNTYEVLREIGRGEHGKVKLARDLINNELVAIKIVSRKSRRPALRMRKNSTAPVINEYELKTKREIAIMKKCQHKHIVALREVLDDLNSLKIYLVLEYMEKGEIKWKRFSYDRTSDSENRCYDVDDNEIPCCGSKQKQEQSRYQRASQEGDLLSNEFSPNLTFKQSRKIFRDVVLGLEYLHMQGIVHRDIKPANLLVSADNVVKISDFGVSFAASLAENEEGHLVNELDLAKTAGTPAFFAPELCQFGDCDTDGDENRTSEEGSNSKSPNIDYKIDIWALGVTLYCLLFGKVPFNAETEYDLFQVIVNQPLEFPNSIADIKSPGVISEEEFELAKDLLSRMLDKNNHTRMEIADIKVHPFTLMDLDDDIDALNEFYHLNGTADEPLDLNLEDHDIVSKEEIDNAVIGIGTRLKRALVKAIRAGGMKDGEIRNKFAALQLENSKSENSEESSSGYSNFNSSTKLAGYNHPHNYSMILSEGLPVVSATPPPPLSSPQYKLPQSVQPCKPAGYDRSSTHIHSSLSHQIPNSSSSSSSSVAFPNHFSFAGMREGGKSLLHEMIESNSNSSSRRGSSAGIAVSEAPQIETKRNVGGDLYLKNQSAMETFKGIQLQDDKRRRSSIFSLHSQVGVNSNKSSLSHESTIAPTIPHSHHGQQQQHSHYSNIAAPIPVPVPTASKFTSTVGNPQALVLNPGTEMKSALKVGPSRATIGDEKSETQDSSMISLPLSESFASLDSINDDYLSMKYSELAINRDINTKSEMKNPAPQPFKHVRRQSSLSESDLVASQDTGVKFNVPDTELISEKFKAFNLGNSMKRGRYSANKTDSENSLPVDDRFKDPEDAIAPNTTLPPVTRYTSTSSYSSFSTSSSDEEDDSEDDDDENLTLAFHSKVAPVSRANFLTLTGRAKSHESNLPTLGRANNPPPEYEFEAPIIFHDGLPEFEDVPDALINQANGNDDKDVPISGYSYYGAMNPGIVSHNVSSTTLTGDMMNASTDAKLAIPGKDNAVKISSPLNPRAAGSSSTRNSTLQQDGRKRSQRSLRENAFNNQFNNHYKKDPVYSPFPVAKHLDNDQEAITKESENKFLSNRPSFFRSNSVTVGLLQRGDKFGSLLESPQKEESSSTNNNKTTTGK
ncbi:SAK1 SNF1-activating kinase 1 [Candida maltosa Xu316]